MHKFSAEFDMNRFGWILVSEDPAANAIARFQHNDFAACDAEITRCSKTSGPRADDQNIRSFVSEIRVVINDFSILLPTFLLLLTVYRGTAICASAGVSCFAEILARLNNFCPV